MPTVHKYFLFQIISKIRMEKYIRFCRLKSRELGVHIGVNISANMVQT